MEHLETINSLLARLEGTKVYEWSTLNK
jgi:hypothetical protein